VCSRKKRLRDGGVALLFFLSYTSSSYIETGPFFFSCVNNERSRPLRLTVPTVRLGCFFSFSPFPPLLPRQEDLLSSQSLFVDVDVPLSSSVASSGGWPPLLLFLERRSETVRPSHRRFQLHLRPTRAGRTAFRFFRFSPLLALSKSVSARSDARSPAEMKDFPFPFCLCVPRFTRGPRMAPVRILGDGAKQAFLFFFLFIPRHARKDDSFPSL